MCGNGSGRSNANGQERSAFGTAVTKADYARTAGMMGSLGGMFMNSMQRQNPGAFGGGGGKSNGQGQGTPQTAALGEQKKPAGTLMNRAAPVQANKKTGLGGLDEMFSLGGPLKSFRSVNKEVNQAIDGSSLNPTDGGEVVRGDDGGLSISPNRGLGAIRDGLAKAVGSPYDRSVTPARAATEISKGPGTLARTVEGLAEGNMQYSGGKLAPDNVGLAIDAFSPVSSLARGDFLGALLGGVNAVDTFADHQKTFGSSKTKTATNNLTRGPRTVAALGKGTLGSRSDEDSDKGGILMQRPVTSPTQPEKTTPASVSTVRRQPRGKSTLNKTGGQGLTDRPNILMRRLFTGDDKKKRQPILMQHQYR